MARRSIEKRLESLVEGAMARAFRTGLRPVEVARRLIREMDDARVVDASGRTVTANHFAIRLSPDDYERFAEVRESLTRQLAETAREHARDEHYGFMGPVGIDLEPDDHLRTSSFRIDVRLREAEGGRGAGALVLPNGERVLLGEEFVTIGRLPECTICLADPNVSRHHVEIRPRGMGFQLIDLGSTNGCTVNGVRVGERDLVDGDQIRMGNTLMIFEAS
ncbi:MAG: DUF3662 domain-containing protein [Actinomycetia bacterium]|nr:DUF3662 domain-containing protein [Actinomycetes bacterium]MCP4087756.1 DUF3662 domain-containing protein [Actinomycetes bacterium]